MSNVREVRTTPFAMMLGVTMLVMATAALAVTASMTASVTSRRAIAPCTRLLQRFVSTKAPRPAGQFARDAQRAGSGVGALMHRRYSVDIPRSAANRQVDSAALMGAIKSRIAKLSPAALAQFRKTNGRRGAMRVGDEYDITMLGPWNGRVRVVSVARESFTLITLTGHPESGHITFRVQELRVPGRPFRVSIESWARSRNATVDLMYSKLGIGKHMQAKVWVTFLRRACALAGLTVPPRIRVMSEEINA